MKSWFCTFFDYLNSNVQPKIRKTNKFSKELHNFDNITVFVHISRLLHIQYDEEYKNILKF